MAPQQASFSSSFPAALEAPSPGRFDRIQLLVRLLVLVAIGLFHRGVGGIFGALYLLLPIVAAIQIGRKGGAVFVREDARWLVKVLDWILAVYAYLLFVTDRFPLESRAGTTRLVVHPNGSPTVGAALLRLLTSIPHVVILAVLGFVATLIGLLAAVCVLITERYPAPLHAFQRDVAAWMMRLLTYHASLIDEYPPFTFRAAAEGTPSTDQRPHAPVV